ncbi:V-type proton ATPase 116 kDa subunit a 1-like isoform X2 [Gordionus sp. m RMFG-2023]|uniref:V-type proton ATPase 116 kDa subunit a 1-like isoform X2 n=1 Tax=Gordionus sp. m RMFG-2023 TaxID=3053472 RepID=UPI0031FBEA88
MGQLFRSEEMTLCQFFLQAESAYSCVAELGELGLVQFRDLNPEVNAFQRKFTNEVRRCDEMERKLRFLQKEIQKDGIPMLDTGDNPPAPLPREMIDLEATFEKLEAEMKEVNTNAEALKKNYLELTELKQILRKTHAFFDEIRRQSTPPSSPYPHKTYNRLSKFTAKIHSPPSSTFPLPPLFPSQTQLITERTRLLSSYPSSSNSNDGDDSNPLAVSFQMHDTPRGITARRTSMSGTAIDDPHSYLIPPRPPPPTSPQGDLISIGGDSSSDSNIRAPIAANAGNLSMPGGSARKLGFVAGVVLRERFPSFEKLLWRACRGNVFLRRSDIDNPLEDPVTGDKVFKVVFMIFFQGDQLRSRVKKICEAFRATLYPCPETAAERREMEMGVMTRIEDLSTVLSQTQEHRHRVMVAAAKNAKFWFIKVRKIKAVYYALNMCSLDVTHKCLIAEGWCPVADFDKIRMALKRGEENSGSSVPCIMNKMEVPSNVSPPTYNKLNKYTSGFQNIVDAYGAAKYREVNPTPYTMITFPFLFAVMFGDAGHGLIMAMVGAYMIIKERSLARMARNETFGIFYGGRYIVFGMGLFAIYTGLLYNDVFSKSINIFGSAWKARMPQYAIGPNPSPGSPSNRTYLSDVTIIGLDPRYPAVYRGSPYPYGIDPIWQLAKNKITFTNSYKMKISIILGVIHMSLGICLSLFNHTYYRNRSNIITEFIPQFLFLFCLFGYLCIVIVVKWIKFNATNSRCAPSLLINLINMFLLSYPPPAPGEICSPYLFKGQKTLQYVLVIVAVLCIPWMLLPKPLLLRRKNKNFMQDGLLSPNNIQDPAEGSLDSRNEPGVSRKPSIKSADEGEVFNFSEIMIEQCIHTIEFSLGCLSHTASYLRLWALSLAHAQLSEVLWQMVFRVGFSFNSKIGSIVLYVVFAFWAVLTVAILLFMEGLSAFLHALRLHWVEFQSKFYSGTGYLFEPFSFQYILDSVAMIGGSEE